MGTARLEVGTRGGHRVGGSMGLGSKRWLWLGVVMAAVILPLVAWADARTDRLVTLLRSSGNYRVRVQSAQSLGRIRDPQTVQPLVGALGDSHPAVRAAAALALGRIGSSDAVGPLNRLARDRRQPPLVQNQARQAVQQIQRMVQMSSSRQPAATSTAAARFYVGVGEMGNTTGSRSGELESTLQRFVQEALNRAGGGIEVAPLNESINQTKRVLQRRRLRGYYVQGSVTRLEAVGGQVHAVVSIMVLSNPERDLRMMLQGRGMASMGNAAGAARRRVEDAALEGAVRGAVSRLAQQLSSQP
jgi:hypothetical protein